MEQTTLYYRQGASDKVYQTSIEPHAGGFIVKYSYGRRGAMMQTGTKTPTAVDYSAAKAIYNKLVQEKKSKGYTPGENGVPYQHTDKQDRATEFLPQLLNPIEDKDVHRFIDDPDYIMQEKFDGQRILIQKEGAAINGINRKGLICGIPSVLINEMKQIPGDCVLDGECIGEVYWAFDILALHGTDVRGQPYRDRLFALARIISSEFGFIKLVDTVHTVEKKMLLLGRMNDERREGVVFKHLDAPYTSGRPSSGGSQFKHKFYATASFIVGAINGKRSVGLRLLSIKGAVFAGNVTIPPNHQVPTVGAVVEVRYLYAFKSSGVIYQPIYLGQRNDLDTKECQVGQLKFKAE